MKLLGVFKSGRFLGAIAFGITIFFSMHYFGLRDYLSLAYLYEHMVQLRIYVAHNYVESVFLYMAAYVLAAICAIPGASFFTIAGGFLFGFFSGFLYAIIAAGVGATLLFLLSRYCVGEWVQKTYEKEMAHFNNEMRRYGGYYLLVMRLIAVLPFCVVNMLSGLTSLPVQTFVLVTVIGLIPSSMLYIYTGVQLGNVTSVNDLFCPPISYLFAGFLFFKILLIPLVYKIGKRLWYLKNTDRNKIGYALFDHSFGKVMVAYKKKYTTLYKEVLKDTSEDDAAEG